MSDEDIKKALECCRRDDYDYCKVCPYLNKNKPCQESLIRDCFGFINRQQAEIKKLKWEKDHFEFKVDDLNGKLEKFKEYRDIKNEAYEREIEKLQAEIKQAKSEAIKEFAERLRLRAIKTRFDAMYGAVIEISNDTITEIVKELEGGENA